MAAQRWAICLRIETAREDGTFEGTPDLAIDKCSSWKAESGLREVNECIACDMAYVMKMVMESGSLIDQSSLKETADAFWDVCCND